MNRANYYRKMEMAAREGETRGRAEAGRLLIIRRICDEIAGRASEWNKVLLEFVDGKEPEVFEEEFEVDLQTIDACEGPFGFKVEAETIVTPEYGCIGRDFLGESGEGEEDEEKLQEVGEKVCADALEALEKKEAASREERDALSLATDEFAWLLAYAADDDGAEELVEAALSAAGDVYFECGWRQFYAISVRSVAMGAFQNAVSEGRVSRRDAARLSKLEDAITRSEASRDDDCVVAYFGSAYRDGEFFSSTVYQGDEYRGSGSPFAFGLLSLDFLAVLEDAREFLKRMDRKYGFMEKEKGGLKNEAVGTA